MFISAIKMASRRRSPLTVQEEILLETNFDDESGTPQTRQNKVYRIRNSDLSIDRYSEGSLRRGQLGGRKNPGMKFILYVVFVFEIELI